MASPVYPPRVPREGPRVITRWLKLLSVAILFSGATTVQRWAETRLVSRGGGQMILENGRVLGGGAERTWPKASLERFPARRSRQAFRQACPTVAVCWSGVQRHVGVVEAAKALAVVASSSSLASGVSFKPGQEGRPESLHEATAPRQLPSLQCCPCGLGRAGRHSSCDSSLVSTVGVSFSSGASCAGPTSWYEVRGNDPNGMSPRPAAPSAGHVARHVASGGQSPRRPMLWWLLRPPLRQCGVSFKCFLFWLSYLRSAAASFTSVLPL